MSSELTTELLCVKFDKTKYPQTYNNPFSTEFIWKNFNYDECYYERTAIKNIENQQLIISPNPVKDLLQLTLPNKTNEIKIFDIQGKTVLQTECGETANINVSMLPKGVYTLVVNGTESQKFVNE